MSPSLPPEMLDLIVDQLYGERAALNVCCTVSKSWVPRARRLLFFHIRFSLSSPIESWMKVFPDPSSSPSRYTRILTLHGSTTVNATSTHACAWVRTFSHIVDLRISAVQWNTSQVSLVPLHELFPTLSSLSLCRFYIPPSQVLKLIYSFPLLRDLRLYFLSTEGSTVNDEWNAPSIPQEFTGSLHLDGEIRSVIPGLLSFPNCLRFAKIAISCHVDDEDLTTDLVLKCSDTLESLSIDHFSGMSALASVVGRYLIVTYTKTHAGSQLRSTSPKPQN
jgi:hypothetical protein